MGIDKRSVRVSRRMLLALGGGASLIGIATLRVVVIFRSSRSSRKFQLRKW